METSARLLRLLSLLQTPRDWNGGELSERLGVSRRTVRTDIERLRRLGYPVHATRGAQGGYRLGSGAVMPPLILDDEEAVAVALGLRTASEGALAGVGETALRVLAKLEQVLPSRSRRRVNALRTHTVPVPSDAPGPSVSADTLVLIAGACRDRRLLRFEYSAHGGEPSRRQVEPYQLVNWGRRWYLFAWDRARDDWRTFRVDRMAPSRTPGAVFTPRQVPEDVTARVSRGASSAAWRYRASVTVHASAEEVERRITPAVGTVRPLDTCTCVLDTGADSPRTIAVYLGMLGLDFTLDGPAEVVEHLRELSERYRRATV
ncbi:YafY family protein [Nocardiopsis oceani]